MAQIRLLQMGTNSVDAARQLQVLVKAVADGVDLGPRSFHIQAKGQELGALSIELRQLHAVLLASSGNEPAKFVTLLDQLQSLSERLEKMAALTRAYPV